MASAIETMDDANYHHGRGLTALAIGTASGFVASGAIGAVYAKWHDKWYGKHAPWMIGILGKLAAVGIIWASRGRWTGTAVVANDIGQAGVNALGLHLGVVMMNKVLKQQWTLKKEGALPAGETRIAGELPPAAPGRSLENISVEDMANMR